ncbi:hypothetical protein A2U01_0072599, partial [Trifolium medium]|nr:hypothetical protein [Trifolium medium]
RFRDPGDFGGAKKEVERSGTVSSDKWKGKRLSPAELEDRHERIVFQMWREMGQRSHLQV